MMITHKLLEFQEFLQKTTDALDVILQETAFQNELKEITKAEGKDTDVPTKNEPKADVSDTNVGKWISVSERLPEDEQNVLVYSDSGNIEVTCGSYSEEIKDEFIWYTSGWTFGKVIAWMPLPERYKESEE